MNRHHFKPWRSLNVKVKSCTNRQIHQSFITQLIYTDVLAELHARELRCLTASLTFLQFYSERVALDCCVNQTSTYVEASRVWRAAPLRLTVLIFDVCPLRSGGERVLTFNNSHLARLLKKKNDALAGQSWIYTNRDCNIKLPHEREYIYFFPLMCRCSWAPPPTASRFVQRSSSKVGTVRSASRRRWGHCLASFLNLAILNRTTALTFRMKEVSRDRQERMGRLLITRGESVAVETESDAVYLFIWLSFWSTSVCVARLDPVNPKQQRMDDFWIMLVTQLSRC